MFVCCTVSEKSKRGQRSFRSISCSSNRDNVWFHTSVVVILQVSGRCHDYQAVGKFSKQSSTNHNNIGRLKLYCEDLPNNWTSYEERKDWRICHGFQNNDERWIRRWLSIEKPQLCCLVKSRSSINCSNVFAKIDIPLPLKFVDQHLPDSRIVLSDKSHATTNF